jgi:hypothetical protein
MIAAGFVMAAAVLGVGLTATPGLAVDAATARECLQFIDKAGDDFAKTKAKIREIVAEYLELRVACDAPGADEARCERKSDRLIGKVEKLSEKLFDLSDEFFTDLEKLPDCEEALGDLGVDDTMLY